jgi:hypothetical protein
VPARVDRRAHAQAGRLHAGLAQIADDGRIGAAHLQREHAAEFALQQVAYVLPLAHRLDALQQGQADGLGPQGIAFHGLAEQRSDIALELTQFPFAGVLDFETEAVGRDLAFNLLVLDQAERIPGGFGAAAAAWGAVLPQPLVQALVEGKREHRRLAVELELRAQQGVALEDVAGRQRSQAQALDRAFHRRTRGQLQPLGGGFEQGVQTMDGMGIHGAEVRCKQYATPARPPKAREAALKPACSVHRGSRAAGARPPAWARAAPPAPAALHA